MIPDFITESLVPIAAGLFVSLVNKFILNNPNLETCFRTETEEIESDSDDTTKTNMSEALSRSSAITASTMPPPHIIHTPHYHYVPHTH